MKKPKILMVSGNGPPIICGVGDYTANLLQTFQHQRPDWDWQWMCRKPRWFSSPIASYRSLRVIRPTHTWNPLGAKSAVALVNWLRPDLIHIQDQIHSYFQSDAAVRIATAAKCPVVVTLHELHDELPSVRHTIKLVEKATAVISNDTRTSDRCRRLTGRNPDFQGWSPANVLPLERKESVKPISGMLTTFGLISPIKQLPIVFEALQELKLKGLSLHWRIIGPFTPASNPYHAELREMFNVPWIEFTGGFPDVHDTRLRALLAESDAMILPFADGASTRRGSLQAAWAFGLPVITTPPPMKEPDIQDGFNCLLVNSSNLQGWVAAIERVVQEKKLREELSAGSHETAKHFSWERLADLHIEIYSNLLN